MSTLPKPSSGYTPTDVSIRLKVDGSEAVDGTGAVGSGTIEFGNLIPGPQGIPGVVTGPTPPTDHSLLWVDTTV